MTTYVVKPGDSLSLIALRFTGDAGNWTDLMDANFSIDDPNLIQPGQVLTLPDAWSSRPASPAVAVSTSIPSSPAMSAGVGVYALLLLGALAIGVRYTRHRRRRRRSSGARR